MDIKILGTGCPSCKKLEQHVKEALKSINMNATITKVTDIKSIMSYGVLSTPALVVDEKVMSSGQVISIAKIVEILKS